MEQLLWKILDESKGGKVYLPAGEQYNNLSNILAGLDKKTVQGLYGVWDQKLKAFKGPKFNKLHRSKGGIVEGGDDAFELDFANWLLAQGEAVYNNFNTEDGHKLVIAFIRGNGIPNEDLIFENMGYALKRDLEKKSAPNNPAEFHLGELRNIIFASKNKVQVGSLVIAGQSAVVGFRVGYNVTRMVNGKKSFWQFDIPNDGTVPYDHRQVLLSCSMGSLELRPHGNLLITQEEYNSGINAIFLEGNKRAIELIVASLMLN